VHHHHVKIRWFKGHLQVTISDSVAPQYFILPLKSGGSSAGIAFQRSLKVILAPDFIPYSDSKQKSQNILAVPLLLEHSMPIPNLIILVYVH
jgi:hypothetical protein